MGEVLAGAGESRRAPWIGGRFGPTDEELKAKACLRLIWSEPEGGSKGRVGAASFDPKAQIMLLSVTDGGRYMWRRHSGRNPIGRPGRRLAPRPVRVGVCSD